MNNNKEILSQKDYDELVKKQIEISKKELEKAFEKMIKEKKFSSQLIKNYKSEQMRYTIGKLKIKQIEGTTADDIRYRDENSKEYDFDEFIKLIKDEKQNGRSY